MDTQTANYFTLLLNAVAAFLTATSDMQARFQEAFDRGIPGDLAQMEFSGDLDHLDQQELTDLFATWQEIIAVMEADDREGWSVMLAVVRSWTR